MIGRAGAETADSGGLRGRRRDLAVVAVTVLFFGIGFGLLARSAGLTPVQATVMSLITAAGSTQIAAVAALVAGSSPLAAVFTGLALSLRYVPLGVAAGAALHRRLARRLLDVHLLTDQGILLGRRPDGSIDAVVYRAAGLVVLVTWVGGTAIGALGGGVVQDPAALGLDAAYPALFLALLGPQLRSDGRMRAAAAAGLALALGTYLLLPPGLSVVVATAGALAAWRPRARAERRS